MKKWICAVLAVLLALGMVLTAAQPVSAASSMTSSDAMIAVVKQMEGFRAKPYWDYGQWTVGYGTRCPDDKLEEYKANGISEEAAEKLLKQAMASFEASVNSFADKYALTFSQQQFDALVSFTYNCGPAWMSETTGYLNQAIRMGYTGSKLIYALGLFSSAGGEYILIGRRLCEANMYLNGVYKASNSGANAYPSTYKWVFLDADGGRVKYAIYAYDAAEKKPVDIAFTKIPTGVDSEGKVFAYDFAGWYTASGKQVTVLDTSLTNGQVLYAKWKDPSGNIVSLPKGEKTNINVSVTGDSVNVRSGPATYYDKVTAVTKGTEFTVTEIYEVGSYTWGKFAKGWIRLDYTNYESVKESSFPKTGTVTGSDVNYRTKPEVSSSTLVGQKQKGDQVTIVEEWYSGTMLWGKMSDGYWISMNYVTYDPIAALTVTGIQMWRLPDKTEYFQGAGSLETAGGVVLVNYNNGTATALSLTSDMVSGFSSAKVGTVKVKVTCSGKTTTFPVTIVSQTGTVTFKNYDGTVLSSKTYNYGDTVEQPAAPTRQPENGFTYEFIGWDKEVTACTGDAVYTAVYRAIAALGDLTEDGSVNNEDVVYLLWYTLFPEDYPLSASADYTGDAAVNNDDVVYLLWHTLFPEDYPLS